MKFLLDTNIIIGLLDGQHEARDALTRDHIVPAETAISQITRMEVLAHPAMTTATELIARAFMNKLLVLMLDDAVEADAIRIRRQSRLKLPDAIIAATSRVHGLKLVTLDSTLASKIAALPA